MSNESIYKSTLPFTPVKTTDERVHQSDILNGCVYFATDTGKIYMDMDNERTTLGGSGAAVLYCTSSSVLKDTEGNYIISVNNLDDKGASPKEDDLIINSDGRFFRVNYFNKSSGDINCTLIAVSGTGGGGSGGGGGGATPETDPKVINVEYLDVEYSFLYGSSYFINFIATAKKDKNLNVSWEVFNNKSNSIPIDTGSKMIQSGEEVSLEVGRKMTPEGGYHRVSIQITGANSYLYENDFNKIKCIDLRIDNDPNNFNNHKIFTENFDFYAIVHGQINKTFHVAIDGIEKDSKNLTDKQSNISASMTIRCGDWGLMPGAHTLSAWLSADGVPSNKLLIDFIYHPAGTQDTTYVLISNYPTRVLSYELPPITYWVYNTALGENAENTIRLLVNGVEQGTITYAQKQGDAGLIWNVTGLIPNANNTCAVQSGGVSREVIIYCEKSDIFDEVTGSSYLLLNADGRTNDVSLEKRLIWEYKNNYDKTIKASLLNFNWDNNGWVKDNDGRACLRVSNGASVEIPLAGLFEKANPTTGGYTFEFEFRPYNLYSYNLLTKSTTTIENENDAGDEEVTIEREFDVSLAAISYIGTDANDGKAVGLCCGTQDAFFRMSDGKNVSVRYMEDNIVNVAVTINAAKSQILMYVNGVASGMAGYSSATAFLPINADKLIINSDQCDLDLYSIRIYKAALSSQDIVQNYIASKKDLDIYEQNKFAAGAKVNLSELKTYNTDNPDNATIPYIVFKTKGSDVLPYNKANADIICDIEFTNPALDYALSIKDIDEAYYKKHCPSFLAEGVTLNVQGTSSQKYPRKNFKGKFKKAISNNKFNCTNPAIQDPKLSKFYMNEHMGEKTFTWKADYMDSSSCHNTGFASYAQELYWNHPLDYYKGTAVNFGAKNESGRYHEEYRTTLFGFPVLAFHETPDGTAEFIGIYNFNLDKGADDTLGMALEDKHPYVNGTFTDDDGVEHDLDFAHICECWEMSNNAGGRCSFRGNPFDFNYDYEREKYIAIDQTTNEEYETHSDLGDDLEVRYHINGDAIEGAWMNLDAPADDGGNYIGPKAAFEVLLGGNADGTGRTGAYTHLEKFFKWIQSCFYAFDLTNDKDKEWAEELLGRALQFDENGNLASEELDVNNPNSYAAFRKARKDKFEAEFDKHLNKEYCMVYYIMTELLLQFDSRGKNMMFSSWGPVEEGGDYIWFPIYYDIDTQLGVNNSGVPTWEYNVEPTTGFNNAGGAKAFSTTNSLLWMNFHASFVEDKPNEIRNAYRALRDSGKLTIAKLNGYYDFNYDISKDYCMKGILPINIINANQNYKYIAPSETGYIDGIDATGKPTYKFTDAYFYCLQGTRELHRAQFLRNRFNYYDSKFMAQGYNPGATGGTDHFWRVNAYNYDKDSLDSNLLLHIKPILDQYIVIWLDDLGTNVQPFFVKGGTVAEIDLKPYLTDATSYTQQIVHIGGPAYVQEYGNLSLIYLDEFEFKYPILTKMELGNPDPDYRPDPNFKTDAFSTSTANKPLLKVFDITNVTGMKKEITSLDLTSSAKLETFKSLGTKLTNVAFAPGVNLKHLYLPNTLSEVHLNKAPNLSKIVYNKNEISTVVNGKLTDVECMYIDNVITTDENGNPVSTNISNIEIIGGNLNLYSYDLLLKMTKAKQAMHASGVNSKLGIQMKDVQWSPFVQLGEGATYDANRHYKYATNNFSYIDYQYNKDTWDQDVLSGRIYRVESRDLNSPTSLELIDIYVKDSANMFINDIHESVPKMPILTGDLYIDNIEPISEAKIANEYNQLFPGLNIRAKNIEDANRARFVHTYTGVEKEIEVQRFIKREEASITTPVLTSIPNPVYYKFYGWTAEKPSGDPYLNEGVVDNDNIIKPDNDGNCDFSNHTFSDEISELTFYAIYQRDEFTITYYDLIGSEKVLLDKAVLTYGQLLTETEVVPNRQEENNLPFNKCYRFKGWTQNIDKCGILSTQTQVTSVIEPNIDALKASQDYVFYAVYLEEDAFEVASDNKYFIFNEINDLMLGVGYSISIKNKYRNHLSGKITLPAKYNDMNVVSVGDFSDIEKISHVFFQKNAEYQSIGRDAFRSRASYGSNTLKGVYMPITIKHIDSHAFYKQTGLKDIAVDESFNVTSHLPEGLLTIGDYAFAADVNSSCQFNIASLPESLTTLGMYAFNKGGPNITISVLPSKLTSVKSFTFAYCQNVIIDTIGGNSDIPFSIGARAFLQLDSNAGANRTEVQKITLGGNVNRIEQGAFDNYGPSGGVIAYTPRSISSFDYISGSTDVDRAGNTGLRDIVDNYTGSL